MVNETVEQFLARGGKVTRVETGVRAIADDRSIYDAIRAGTRVAADSVMELRLSERRAERRAESYGAARLGGMSVADSLDSADDSVQGIES